MNDVDARRLLASARSATLGTTSQSPDPAEGQRSHLVPCCFAIDGDVVYTAIDGKPKSTMALRRLANIAQNPAACLLVDHFEEDWTKLWWVRADGTARIIDPESNDPDNDRSGSATAEWASAIDLLVAKYPQYMAMRPAGPVIALDISRWRSWTSARPVRTR